ncbi:MAG: translation initiation factor IF-2 [Dehalococcoidales bacterium]
MTGTSQSQATGQTAARPRVVELPSAISVKQLAELLGFSAVDTIKHLMRRGVMASINEIVNFETAATIAVDFGLDPRPEPVKARRASRIMEAKKKRKALQAEEHGGMKPHPPVVTIMGHVNHGKTRLLDTIRKTNVVDEEAGGITQHIGAYQTEVNGQKMTFLDTPGHEAFTAMRAHGAQVTDITILVVAADDGVMPQTLEAIDHAKAAGVPIVVAINKIDVPTANVDLVKQQLADAGLVVEEWGGDTVCVAISAREGTGVPELLENLMVVAEVEDLKADPSRPADGVVVEAEMDRSRGPMATVLVHSGTLRVGDVAVVGENWGRIKAMFNEAGKRVKRATPSTPVAVLGLDDVPQVGGVLSVVASDRQAQALIAKRREAAESQPGPSRGVSLTNLYD